MVSRLIRRAPRFFAIALAIGCSPSPEPSAAQASGVVVPPNSQITQSRQNAITTAASKVAPSVVTVQTEVVEQSRQDPFDIFFGRAAPRTQSGLGTGFVVRSDGVIVTNAHVVSGANRVSVMMRDGTVHPAKVLGADETNDLAVLKIDAKGLPNLKLGNSNTVVIGEWAIAIGNPYGFYFGNSEPSVSVGVISATQRNLMGSGDNQQGAYFDMIQTDAAINPGNSGGPLVNADGEVIGVNTNIFSPTGSSVGLGFAIPINRVARVVDDLLTHGSIRSPWIGVRLRQTQSNNPRDLISRGAVIETVVPGSPADKAGLKPGDVILREGSRVVHNTFDWYAALLDLRVGSPARLHIRRDDRELDVEVNVSDLPEVTAPKVQVLRELELVTVTPAIAAERGLRTQNGALVYTVGRLVSDQTGIQPGDVIIFINNNPVRTAQDVARAIEYYAGRSYLRVVIERKGQRYITEFAVR